MGIALLGTNEIDKYRPTIGDLPMNIFEGAPAVWMKVLERA
jgi:hypothetical protein